jgi:aspartyl-tRNA(Asn)/glutamyl-tRNA(Gln) amidotransferase subunit B
LQNLPELPLERRFRFTTQYGLPEYDAEILTAERQLSDYFETAVREYGGDPKKVSNWLMNDVLRMINDRGLTPEQMKLTAVHLASILKLVDAGTINTNTGKSLLIKVEESGKSPAEIVAAEGLAKVSDDSAIRSVAQALLAANPKEVEAYKGGKTTLMGWFVGQVMREMRGKADAGVARRVMEELLGG